ncbi:MAG: hypothetical protein GXY07_02400 [Candidatus Hydrogenedentes bacterium]|nr:hypothetical protein [Candidatus Hydrogenedentota bacterium]
MLKKKRLALLACALLLGWVGWRAGFLVALACLAGAVALLLFIKAAHIVRDRFGMDKLTGCERHRFEVLQAALPEPPRRRPWNFIVLGDTRNNTKIASALYRHARVQDPVMAFHTGDIVRGGTASELLRNHVHPVEEHLQTVPLFCVPGNHERGPRRDYAAFKTLYGDDKFSFSHDGCLFVGFNNCTSKGVTDEDLAFLEKELGGAYEHKFVFTHIPPAFFEAEFVGDTRRRGFKRNAEAFHQLMCDHAVDEVFMAHIHGYASAKIGSVRYTLTAGGGAPLSRRIAEENRHFHLIRMEVLPEGIKRTLMLYQGGEWSSRLLEG